MHSPFLPYIVFIAGLVRLGCSTAALARRSCWDLLSRGLQESEHCEGGACSPRLDQFTRKPCNRLGRFCTTEMLRRLRPALEFRQPDSDSCNCRPICKGLHYGQADTQTTHYQPAVGPPVVPLSPRLFNTRWQRAGGAVRSTTQRNGKGPAQCAAATWNEPTLVAVLAVSRDRTARKAWSCAFQNSGTQGVGR